MHRAPLLLAALLLTWQTACATRQGLPTSTPEAEGVSSDAVLAFVEALEKEVDAPHGVVLLRHGKVIAEGWWSPFDRHAPHMLYSLSKSFTSTAIGMAVDEGRLSVEDKVLSFFPDDAPENASENLKAMRVRDLLTMTTGHARDTLPALTSGKDANWPKVFLAEPVEHKPGTHFLYNTGATYMCSAILQKITGETLLEYLTPRLFEPLGIKNPTWESDPRGINVGGWGLKVTTTDIANFGQLYLQKGVWKNRRLLSESWIAAATSAQVPNGDNPQSDWNQGYGYQFWRSRHNAYRGDGAMGQFCIVFPEHEAVLAITAGQKDMQHVLNLVWKHLLPALHTGPLPTDKAAQETLRTKLAALNHPTVHGEPRSTHAAGLSGKTFVIDANNEGIRAATFQFGEKVSRVTLHTATGEQRFELTQGSWRKQRITFEKLGLIVVAKTGPEAVAASGAWAAPDRFVLQAWMYESPYRLDMEFLFDVDQGKLIVKRKLHPMQTEWTQVTGSIR